MSQNPKNDDEYTDAEYDEYADQDYEDQEVTDEWQDEEEVLDEDGEARSQESAAPVKKKSNILIYAIVGVVVLAAGGFFVMSMGGNKAPNDGAASPQQVTGKEASPENTQDSLQSLRDKAVSSEASPVPVTPQQDATPPKSAQGGGFMDEPSILQQPEGQAAPVTADPSGTAPAPSLVNVEPPKDPLAGSSTEALQQPEPAPSAEAPAVQPVSDFPTADKVMKAGAEAPVEPPVEAVPDMTAAPVPDVQTPAPDQQMTQVEAPVEGTSPVPVAVEPLTTGTDVTSSAELLDARSRIAELEKSLADKDEALKQQKTLASDVDTLRSKIVDLEERLANAQQAQPDMADVTPAQTKPVKAVKAIKATPTSTKAAKPAPSSAQWVLKGAQPGKARVALKGSNDLKTVVVGATLPGIGRVTAIEQGASGWVVKGTQSSIHQ